MIALDTNVVVRLLVRDDPDQAARAEALIRRATAAGNSLYIADVVLAELVWVLERSYKLPRDTILANLRGLQGKRLSRPPGFLLVDYWLIPILLEDS